VRSPNGPKASPISFFFHAANSSMRCYNVKDMKTKAPLTPAQIERRDKIIAYINAGISLFTLILGFTLVTIASKKTAITDPDGNMDPKLFMAVGGLIVALASLIALAQEIVAMTIRRQKSVLKTSLPFAIAYLLLAILIVFVVGYFDNAAFFFAIAYTTIRLGKLIYMRVREEPKPKKWQVGVVILGILWALFVVIMALLFSDPTNSFTFFGFYLIVEGVGLTVYSILRGKNPRKLWRVLTKTHAIEIISGLIFTIVTVSIALSFIEPSMEKFGDALWYCFAAVTTIGFGDFSATTFVGRILTVILGIYGIVVTALITSIIVNLYTESTSEDKSKQTEQVEQKEPSPETQNEVKTPEEDKAETSDNQNQ